MEEIRKTETEQVFADYLDEEGYLCCGKCRTRKQCRVPFPLLKGAGKPETRLVRIRCSCEKEAAKQESAFRQEQEHLDKVIRLKSICFASPARKKQTFENADRLPAEILEKAKSYVNDWDDYRMKNIGLLLWGDCGTGKSYTAACIANALMEKEVSVLMCSISDYLNTSAEDREECCREIGRYDLVIFDDLGMERENEYGLEIAFRLINARSESGRPAIFTTNLSLYTLKHPADLGHKRIYDRVMEMTVPIRFSGPDVRAEIHQDKMMEFKTMQAAEKTDLEME